MPDIITIEDEYGDTIEVSQGEDESWFVTITENEDSTEVKLSEHQVCDLISAFHGPEGSALLEPLYDTDREVYNAEVLHTALRHGRLAVFQYEKGDGGTTIEKRRVQPESAHRNAEGLPSVVGHDPDRGDTRAFRLDRIVGYVKIG